MKNVLLISALAISLQVSAHSRALQPTFVAKTQPPTVNGFDFIRAHKTGKSGINLQWKMRNDANVDHFEVECTYEDPMDIYSNWMLVGNINNFRAVITNFNDNPLYPGIINYKITAVLKNGAGVIESPIFTTVID
ncbi:MAG: hypothetical protein ABI861_14105 [Panacibacter sp.]